MYSEEYIKENNNLALDILDRTYYNNMQKGEKFSLDILLSDNGCGKCSKCYISTINKNKEIDKELLLTNFESILNWYENNKFKSNIRLIGLDTDNFDLFTDIMNKLIDTFTYKVNKPKYITVPISKNVFLNDEYINQLVVFIKLFLKQKIQLIYEIECNGKLVDNFEDDYYVKLFNFVIATKCSFLNATIGLDNIDLWVENALWWSLTGADILSRLHINDEYSNKIDVTYFNKYADVLKILIGTYFEDVSTDEDKLSALELAFPTDEKILPFQLKLNNFTKGNDYFNCSAHTSLCVRCTDLSVPICHNLTDDALLVGKFDKKFKFSANTVELFIVKDHLKMSSIPYCEQCPAVGLCDNICLAHSYKEYNNPLMPVMQECEFQREKIEFIIKLYFDLGLFDVLDKLQISNSDKKYLIDLIELVVKNENK